MMNKLYPLLLAPALKHYIWGGTKLKDVFGYPSNEDIVSEAWLLSINEDGESVCVNGELKGKPFSECVELMGKEALGKNCKDLDKFPILIKFIDALDDLSVQVHPTKEYEIKTGTPSKTEMWYIVDAEEGSSVLFGFNKDLTFEEFKKRVEEGDFEGVVNYAPAKKGDVFFIPAGTLHAIGKGLLIAEVQENSNSTFRVYDYNRVDKFGNKREVHKEKAIEVTSLKKTVVEPNRNSFEKIAGGEKKLLADCEIFKTSIIKLNGELDVLNNDSFVSLIVLEGDAVMEFEKEKTEVSKGTSIFLPAGVKITLSGKSEILSTEI